MFMLKTGWSPRLIPPLQSAMGTETLSEIDARKVVEKIRDLVEEARDTLIQAKVAQAFHVNTSRGPVPKFKEGDRMMLTTVHRWHSGLASERVARRRDHEKF